MRDATPAGSTRSDRVLDCPEGSPEVASHVGRVHPRPGRGCGCGCGLRFAVCGCEHPHQSMTQHPSGLLPAGLGARREPTLPATAGPAGDGIFGSWCLPRTAPTATLQRLRRPRGHRPADVSRPAVSDLPARPPLWRPATRRLRRRRTHKCSGSVDPGSDNAWLLGLFHTGQSDGSMGRTTSCTSAMGSIPTSTARCRWPSAT